ncbi:site-specific integrase [Acidithiobacillus ferrooxidans]|jgi:integrase|uniref:tyrosine-type recombinase/integrase n=1 Tax=Acidithiobacillus ferrooxidans TaxID=920 RepID=UPI000ACBFE1C|nr:site-specific integrase [Acidithiobacillus ferrooxidans]MCR2831102.1 site-specific integrase [Acidithiobacillus ferrooxidans]MDA8151222.1 site-specific integrase [Acidithiobacillus sp.]
MATINSREDQDGITIGWQAIVRRKGHPSQTKTFRAKKDAEAWARSIESEMVRGVWRDRSEAESATLKECLERYAEEIIPTKKGDGRRELGFIRQWQTRPISCRFMAAIDGQDVSASIKEMEAEGKAANTIRLHLALLSHLFEVARKEWRMASLTNPVELVRKPKLPQGRDRRLVADEETRLLSACQSVNPELAAIVGFAIETAMRQGEIIGMTWTMVDLRRRVVHLPDTKNGQARDVPLSTAAERILAALPRRMDGKVWTYTQEGMRASWRRALMQAAITGLHFHDLRHEATSRLFEKGFNPMEVSAITGHKTLQMLKRYTHLRAEDLAKRMG